uniref:1-acylglycerol-3-phosphate O-acyltransferase ABHD5 n=1 Tax=Plectus sambesii TaxID=2011161 RepID=A0A914XLM6_9BILA
MPPAGIFVKQLNCTSDENNSISMRLGGWLQSLQSLRQWVPTSMAHLIEAEERILKTVKSTIFARYLPVRFADGQVWTVTVNGKDANKDKTPLVLIHGFAGGVGIWAQNLDAFASKRYVHAFDLLGFGRSTRPKFSDDPALAEFELVHTIEDWRKEAKIDKMILLGHSFGAYLACSYAIEHPDRVRHLVLVDPWGMARRPPENQHQVVLPTYVRAIARVASFFNPLASVRAAGPFGPDLVKKFRPDLGRRFVYDDPNAIYDYIYHCNAQYPSGEIAFKTMTIPFGWAKRPMIDRLPKLHPSVPMTFIFGGKSWIDPGPGYELKQQLRPHSYVDIQVIKGAGHHVYVDAPEAFNQAVSDICDVVDADDDVGE